MASQRAGVIAGEERGRRGGEGRRGRGAWDVMGVHQRRDTEEAGAWRMFFKDTGFIYLFVGLFLYVKLVIWVAEEIERRVFSVEKKKGLKWTVFGHETLGGNVGRGCHPL